MLRSQLIQEISSLLAAVHPPFPLRVGVDGIDAAGKTRLADELSQALEAGMRTVIRASLDGFHHPRALRYRSGPDSPTGYYQDSFDYQALRSNLLDPLGPGGNRQYRTAIFDHRRDQPVTTPLQTASDDAVLLFDGVFLQRPELAGCLELCIFVEVSFEISVQRALERDQSQLGPSPIVRKRYKQRYIPAQEHYLRTSRPREKADLLVDNNDPEQPLLSFPHRTVFETPRLIVRTAGLDDAGVIYQLWTDPRVMTYVGFPNGLRTSREEIIGQIVQSKQDEWTALLVVERKQDHQPIGECKLGKPDADGISETDVKLLPEFWGNRYGVEIKRGLIDYLFAHTGCTAVQATPNVENVASIRMQEAVGGVKVEEGIYEFPDELKPYTRPVHYYVYRVYRKDHTPPDKH